MTQSKNNGRKTRSSKILVGAAMAGLMIGATAPLTSCGSDTAKAGHNGCNGPNGCGGKDEKEANGCSAPNGCNGHGAKTGDSKQDLRAPGNPQGG